MTLPKTPCPVGGLVPWMGGLWPIVSRKEHPVLGWLYVIHEQQDGGAKVIWTNLSQEDIVKAMEAAAKFKVHSSVDLGRFQRRSILSRKWNFNKGMMVYQLEGSRADNSTYMHEGELIAAIEAAKGQ